MSSAQIQTGVPCRRCGHFRHPREFVGGPYGYCWSCYERHRQQLQMFAGEIPVACQECNRSLADLSAAAAADDIRMEVHIKDGLYQLLCGPCGAAYARKRLDLYGNTPFAKASGLN